MCQVQQRVYAILRALHSEHEATLRSSLLLFNDIHQAGADHLRVQRLEAETRAAGLQGGNDLGHVVANQAEASVLAVLLDNYRSHPLSSRLLRSANWAAFVILSASSRITSLVPEENSFCVPAKFLICSLTTSIPRSSEAFSYSLFELFNHLLLRSCWNGCSHTTSSHRP